MFNGVRGLKVGKMKFFDFLFKSKKEEEIEKKQEQEIPKGLETSYELKEGEVVCQGCFLPIETHVPRTKVIGKSFHRKCFKKIKKKAKKETFG